MAATTHDGTPDGSAVPARAARNEETRAASPLSNIQPILVPLDGSDLAEHALPYAEALATPGCQLILLEVGPDGDEFQLLDRHADECARLETAVGDPAEQILRTANTLGVGLIVMTTHGRGALGRWAFGSVADQVARTSPVPVMIIRPRETGTPPDPTIHRVVAPLDGSALSAQALPTVEAIARMMHAPVHLVTALDLTRLMPVDLMPTVAFNADLYEREVRRAQSDAEAWLAQAATHLSERGLKVTHDVYAGAPVAVIKEIARPGDVIVLASHRRHGAARLMLGSVAEELIRDAPAPVVLVPTVDQEDEQPL